MINWRQLYNESQAIELEETNVSIERISRLVNIYKNDLIEQDLQQYAQRLTKYSRSCQICTPKSFTTYKWLDTYISGEKNLFDFRLSGRAVTALNYYWNKNLFELTDKRGHIRDFSKQMKNGVFSISNLSNIDEDIFIKKHLFIPILSNLITRFQMYYTYRKAYHYSSSVQVHIQPMKTFRSLFQTNVSPIFICFINEDNTFSQLFWTFRHLITRFNWPSTTKIFSNTSFQDTSIFECLMMKSLGFIDLSQLNPNRFELFSFLYRCLKTCQDNGPLIFLFDYSTIFNPKSSDYHLISFLCDLIRFDLSVPDLLIIPTCLYKSTLSFSQPFLFKEIMEHFIQKYPNDEQKVSHQAIDSIFLHLGYDTNQLISTRIHFDNILAAIELTQVSSVSSSNLFDQLQILLQTCSFIHTDNHQWKEILPKDIKNYFFQYPSIQSKMKLISIVRKEYFLDIISALTILSKVDINENFLRLSEIELLDQVKFFWSIFHSNESLSLPPCQNFSQILSFSQTRTYLSQDDLPQKSLAFRDIILSDHEWSDDDNDDDDSDHFLDHDDNEDEIIINDFPDNIFESNKSYYRVNYQENFEPLKFFARLVGAYIEAMIYVLEYHIENRLTEFISIEIHSEEKFLFHETAYLNSNEILLLIQRAYQCQTSPDSENISPLSKNRLQLLHNDFVRLLSSFV